MKRRNKKGQFMAFGSLGGNLTVCDSYGTSGKVSKHGIPIVRCAAYKPGGPGAAGVPSKAARMEAGLYRVPSRGKHKGQNVMLPYTYKGAGTTRILTMFTGQQAPRPYPKRRSRKGRKALKA